MAVLRPLGTQGRDKGRGMRKRRYNVALLGLGLAISAVAASALASDYEVDEFERRARSLGESISAQDSEQSVRCQELGRQVEQLKGRPQQRYTAREAYLRECQRDPAFAPEPALPSGDFDF